jgi:hypothetical protein
MRYSGGIRVTDVPQKSITGRARVRPVRNFGWICREKRRSDLHRLKAAIEDRRCPGLAPKQKRRSSDLANFFQPLRSHTVFISLRLQRRLCFSASRASWLHRRWTLAELRAASNSPFATVSAPRMAEIERMRWRINRKRVDINPPGKCGRRRGA